jgi:hypothetical protein
MIEMSEETIKRALAILRVPRTAVEFFDLFRPEEAGRPRGSRSLAGHVVLRKLVARGDVRRTRGATAALDQFVDARAFEGQTRMPPPQQVPAPPQPNWYPECTAIRTLFWGLSVLPLDPVTRHRTQEEIRVRMLRTTLEMNAWARANRVPELPFVAQLSVPVPSPAPAW